MAIELRIKQMLRKRNMSAGDLAQRIKRTPANLSVLMNDKAVALRFDTLDAICRELDCQPGDILCRVPDDVAPAAGAPAEEGDG